MDSARHTNEDALRHQPRPSCSTHDIAALGFEGMPLQVAIPRTRLDFDQVVGNHRLAYRLQHFMAAAWRGQALPVLHETFDMEGERVW